MVLFLLPPPPPPSPCLKTEKQGNRGVEQVTCLQDSYKPWRNLCAVLGSVCLGSEDSQKDNGCSSGLKGEKLSGLQACLSRSQEKRRGGPKEERLQVSK